MPSQVLTPKDLKYFWRCSKFIVKLQSVFKSHGFPPQSGHVKKPSGSQKYHLAPKMQTIPKTLQTNPVSRHMYPTKYTPHLLTTGG